MASFMALISILLPDSFPPPGPSSADVVRLAMDIGALSVRGNHDHEVVRQGLKYRQRGAETVERDNREARREREREANSINSSSTNSSNGSSSSYISSRDRDMNKDSSSVNRSKGANGTGSSQESGAPKSSSNRIQQHLELGAIALPFLFIVLLFLPSLSFLPLPTLILVIIP